jgi:hypothetical protein
MSTIKIALGAVAGVAIGALAATGISAVGNHKTSGNIESVEVGSVTGVDEFEHDDDWIGDKCLTSVDFRQSIQTSAPITGHIKGLAVVTNTSEPKHFYGYIRNGKGEIAINVYESSKKACENKTASAFKTSKIIYLTVMPADVFTQAK